MRVRSAELRDEVGPAAQSIPKLALRPSGALIQIRNRDAQLAGEL